MSPITTVFNELPLHFFFAFVIDLALMSCGIVLTVRVYQKNRFNKAQLAACIVLIIWSAVVLFMTLLGRRYHDYYIQNYNLELFSCYRKIIAEHNRSILISTIQNIVMFIPIGFTLSVVFKNRRPFVFSLLISFAFSLLIETGQLLLKSGTFELDDLFNNTLGALLGIAVYLVINGIVKLSNKKKGRRFAAEGHR
jgi:glycopeptide antibiotics resistance protein